LPCGDARRVQASEGYDIYSTGYGDGMMKGIRASLFTAVFFSAATAASALPSAQSNSTAEVTKADHVVRTMVIDAITSTEVKAEASAVDPVRLAKAQPIAAAMMQDGAAIRLMSPKVGPVMTAMVDALTKVPVSDLLKESGADPAVVNTMDPGAIQEVLAIIDPNSPERSQVMYDTIFPALSKLAMTFEPDMQTGLAEALAARYSEAELEDIGAFLKTPAGAKFGKAFTELTTDPHYLARMQTIVPEWFAAMAETWQPMVANMEKLPKPRSYKDLTKSERARVAKLLGIDPENIKQ
jgi:hypothetical protein